MEMIFGEFFYNFAILFKTIPRWSLNIINYAASCWLQVQSQQKKYGEKIGPLRFRFLQVLLYHGLHIWLMWPVCQWKNVNFRFNLDSD